MEFQGQTKEYLGCLLLLAAIAGGALGAAFAIAVKEGWKLMSYSPWRSIGLAAGEGFSHGWQESLNK